MKMCLITEVVNEKKQTDVVYFMINRDKHAQEKESMGSRTSRMAKEDQYCGVQSQRSNGEHED